MCIERWLGFCRLLGGGSLFDCLVCRWGWIYGWGGVRWLIFERGLVDCLLRGWGSGLVLWFVDGIYDSLFDV